MTNEGHLAQILRFMLIKTGIFRKMLITKWIFVIMLHFHNLYLHVCVFQFLPFIFLPFNWIWVAVSASLSLPTTGRFVCHSPSPIAFYGHSHSRSLLSLSPFFLPSFFLPFYFSPLPNSHRSLCSSLSVFQFHFQETVPPPRPEISIHPTTSSHFTYLPHFSLYTLSWIRIFHVMRSIFNLKNCINHSTFT